MTLSDNNFPSPLPDDADFELRVRSAMLARSEPAAASNLAAVAMSLARSRQAKFAAERARRLAIQARWLQFTSLAATLLITAILAAAAHRMWTHGHMTSIIASVTSDTSVTNTSDTSSTSDSDSTSTVSFGSTAAVIFVAEFLVLGMVLMSLPRSGPSMPWGPETAGIW